MATTLDKIRRVLTAQNRAERILQAVNKSPLKHVTKSIAITLNFTTHFGRKTLAKDVNLSAEEQQLLQHLNINGYVDLTGFVDQDVLNRLLAYGEDKLQHVDSLRQSEANKTKDFWVRLSDSELNDKAIDVLHPMVQVALNERILRLTAKYLKKAPFLEYVLLTLSLYTGQEIKSSQLWHHDYDDSNMLKFFVYLTDVNNSDDGPFTFIDRPSSEAVKNSFVAHHLADEEVNNTIPPSKHIRMVKPKLGCFLIDTSRCYHMGSRLSEGHRRLLYSALYIGLPSNYPSAGCEKFALSDRFKPTSLQMHALKR